MKFFIISLFIAASGLGQAYAEVKPCQELKDEIAEKIKAAGVRSYRLDIVDTWQVEKGIVHHGKIVGSCEGGTKKIIYTKSDRESYEEPLSP